MDKETFRTLCEEVLFPHVDVNIREERLKLEDMLHVMSAAIQRIEGFIEDVRAGDFRKSEDDD